MSSDGADRPSDSPAPAAAPCEHGIHGCTAADPHEPEDCRGADYDPIKQSRPPPAALVKLTAPEIERCALAGAIAVDFDEVFLRDRGWRRDALIHGAECALDGRIDEIDISDISDRATFVDAVLAAAAAIRQRKQAAIVVCAVRPPNPPTLPEPEVEDESTPGRPHIVNGEFQSDKYPTCPPGKVPLSVKDVTAQDLLWEYAQRRRTVDAQFSDDLEWALRRAGFTPAMDTDALVAGFHDAIKALHAGTGEPNHAIDAAQLAVGRLLLALGAAERQRDEWKHEAETQRAKTASNLRLLGEVKRAREAETAAKDKLEASLKGLRRKQAQWDEVVRQRDEALQALEEARKELEAERADFEKRVCDAVEQLNPWLTTAKAEHEAWIERAKANNLFAAAHRICAHCGLALPNADMPAHSRVCDKNPVVQERDEALRTLAEAVATMRDYVDRENVTHDEDCPADSTCGCSAAPLIARINAVCAIVATCPSTWTDSHGETFRCARPAGHVVDAAKPETWHDSEGGQSWPSAVPDKDPG